MALFGGRHTAEKLVDEHYRPLYRYAYRLSGCAVEAEDLTQETFCKAQMSLSQLRDMSKVKPWLFRILRNVYLQKSRQTKIKPMTFLENMTEVPDRVAEPPGDIDSEQLQSVLNELPEVFRTPIVLYYFEEFSYRDIAEQMDLPIGTVMSRLARAKAHLRARLLLPAPAVLTADESWRPSNGL
jgi:RNA polymerase sigma-70 factor (ECF subfamily)